MVARADSCLTLAAQCAYRNYAGFGAGTVYLFAILKKVRLTYRSLQNVRMLQLSESHEHLEVECITF